MFRKCDIAGMTSTKNGDLSGPTPLSSLLYVIMISECGEAFPKNVRLRIMMYMHWLGNCTYFISGDQFLHVEGEFFFTLAWKFLCLSCQLLHHFTPCRGARKISFQIFVFYWCLFLLCSFYFRLILSYLCVKA